MGVGRRTEGRTILIVAAEADNVRHRVDPPAAAPRVDSLLGAQLPLRRRRVRQRLVGPRLGCEDW